MTVVLVVDDSPVDRALAGGLLRNEAACEVIYASDGESGLKSIRELKPELIITDMQMPVMNGLELVATLRKESNQTPVILMTATGSEDLAVEALRAGASSYVPKHALGKHLAETVRMILNIAHEDREHSILLNRLESHSETFVLHNRIEECRSLSRHLQSDLSMLWGLNQTHRLRVGLALEEALLNALYHGNLEVSSSLKELPDNSFYDLASQRQALLPYSARRIEVVALTTREEARYVITDGGNGFDVRNLPDPTDPENLTKPSGRGVMLMHAFMTEVAFNERGNQVTLIKRRFA